MPLFMDIHNVEGGVGMDDVVQAHVADLATGPDFDVHYLRYWVNEDEGKVFCLVEAPTSAAAETVHRKAHGLVADAIFEVREGL